MSMSAHLSKSLRELAEREEGYKLTSRGSTNRNDRGSSYDRRRRKEWLLNVYGTGELTQCFRCRRELNFDTITVDRIVPHCHGGTYKRGNIRPACGPCNSELGGGLRRTT